MGLEVGNCLKAALRVSLRWVDLTNSLGGYFNPPLTCWLIIDVNSSEGDRGCSNDI